MFISRIQILNYGCLRYIDVPMDRFHLLIGPNASGKSTLMDAIKFVSDVVRDGVDRAVQARTENFVDLVWERPDDPDKQRFEIVLDFAIPDDVRVLLPAERHYDVFQYELAVGLDRDTNRVSLLEERGALRAKPTAQSRQLPFFPAPDSPPQTLMKRRVTGRRTVFRKGESGRSRFNDETVKASGSVNWSLGLNLGTDRSAMSILPEYDDKYPASIHAKTFLSEKVVNLSLNSERMRQASRPGMGTDLRSDGSNAPWVVDNLLQHAPNRARDWIGHIQCALDGFESVNVVDREDDRHKYLMLKYYNGVDVPSWKASDGTLRLMALTMLAYIPQSPGLYMIEEPENGIHPGALQTVFDSLSSVFEAQVLLASHSPEFVNIADVRHLMCFGKTQKGVIDVIPGEFHPHLRDWQYNTNLGTFFASGILA